MDGESRKRKRREEVWSSVLKRVRTPSRRVFLLIMECILIRITRSHSKCESLRQIMFVFDEVRICIDRLMKSWCESGEIDLSKVRFWVVLVRRPRLEGDWVGTGGGGWEELEGLGPKSAEM